jgi:four helix bundle protein
MYTFEELECWKLGTELRRDFARMIKTFPPEEKYELTSQIRRASRSVTNNIAEGFGRYHYQEFIRFCRISRGSLHELKDHVIVAGDEGYINLEMVADFKTRIQRCVAILNGFIKYLEKAKSKNEVNEPVEPYYGIDLDVADQRITNN